MKPIVTKGNQLFTALSEPYFNYTFTWPDKSFNFVAMSDSGWENLSKATGWTLQQGPKAVAL